jgi:hypothetical protein
VILKIKNKISSKSGEFEPFFAKIKSFVQVALAFFMGHQNAEFHQKNNTAAHTHKLDMEKTLIFRVGNYHFMHSCLFCL